MNKISTRTVSQRRNLHAAINSISRAEMAQLILGAKPHLSPREVDALAKQVIQRAHALISPRK